MLETVEIGALVREKLVMAALPPHADWGRGLRELGAKDVLLLGRKAQNGLRRHLTHAEAKFTRLRDVRRSNCQVGILNSIAAIAVSQRRYFWKTHFETILIPLSAALLPNLPGILYYGQRGRLVVEGRTTIDIGGMRKHFLVLRVCRKSSHSKRLYSPANVAPVEVFKRLTGISYVLLRSIERVEANDQLKDIDILVADADLPRLRKELGEEVGTFPIDVYTEAGKDGHDYRTAPYFIPDMAQKILNTAVIRPSGVRVASAKWQYLSLAYHLIFHGKSARIPPGTTSIGPETWGLARHYEALVRAASEAGFPRPATFADLDRALRENGAFPGRDLIGFYARGNPFVTARYINSARAPAGLATFFLRDFGVADVVPRIANELEKEFRILVQGPVSGDNRTSIVARVRGGNWHDPARGMVAEPIHWFVCWDEHPVPPRGRPRRKYPNLDNQRIVEIKQRLRLEASALTGDPTRILHASDNTDEAIEHVHAIGISEHPEVSKVIARVT